MYTLILLLLTIVLFMYKKSFFYSNVYKNNLLKAIIIVVLLSLAATVSSLFFDLTFLGKYYPGIYVSDGMRYLREILLFKIEPWLVDELNGHYLHYHASAKMGMSSLITWMTYMFNIENIYTYYVVNNILFVLISTINLILLSKIFTLLHVNSKLQPYLMIFVILLPFDLYWLLRFLREPCANAFFLLFLLLAILMLMKNKNYLFPLFIVFIFLVLFRVQLALLASSTLLILFIFFRQHLAYIFIAIFFILGSFKYFLFGRHQQLIEAANQLLPHNISSFVNDYILHLLNINNTFIFFILLVFVLFSYMKTLSISPKPFNTSKLKFVLLMYVFVAIFLYINVANIQIRFIYPFIFYLKLFIVFYIIDSTNNMEKI